MAQPGGLTLNCAPHLVVLFFGGVQFIDRMYTHTQTRSCRQAGLRMPPPLYVSVGTYRRTDNPAPSVGWAEGRRHKKYIHINMHNTVHTCGSTQNDGHENDGPSKLQYMKLQDIRIENAVFRCYFYTLNTVMHSA